MIIQVGVGKSRLTDISLYVLQVVAFKSIVLARIVVNPLVESAQCNAGKSLHNV